MGGGGLCLHVQMSHSTHTLPTAPVGLHKGFVVLMLRFLDEKNRSTFDHKNGRSTARTSGKMTICVMVLWYGFLNIFKVVRQNTEKKNHVAIIMLLFNIYSVLLW